MLNQKKIYPWLVVLLCSSFLLYKYVLQISPSVMTQELMQSFHLNGTGLGNLAATYFYTFLFVQLFAGFLLDKFNARYLSTAAILLAAIGIFGFAYAETAWQAGLARGLVGVGVAFATISYMKITSMWFAPEKFGLIAGLAATGAMVGAICGQIPLAYAMQHFTWRETLILCAALGGLIAMIFVFLVRTRDLELTQHRPSISWREIKKVWISKQNWLLTFYSGLTFVPLGVFGGLWGNPFLEEAYQISHTQVAGIISLLFIGMAIGSPLFGWISDRSGQRRSVMMIAGIVSLISCIVLIYLHLPIWALIVFIFIFGLTTGAFTIAFAVGNESNPALLAATVIAMINTGDAIFESISEPLIGHLLDLQWDGKLANGIHYFSAENYQRAFIVLPIYLLVSLICLGFLKEKKSA